MMPKGYVGTQLLDRAKAEFVTISKIGETKVALDVSPKYASSVGLDQAEAGSNAESIVATAHAASAGDLIRFTSGANTGTEISVLSVSANEIILGSTLATPVAAGDDFSILRATTPSVTSSGSFNAAFSFTRDGVAQEIIEDTVDPSNNRPLPVKITSTTGDINITAGDINVQNSHTGANPDSMQIGDGVETVAINASNEMQVADDTARASLATLAGTVTGSEVQVDVVSSALPTGGATAANQATANASLATIEGDTTSLDAKLPAQGSALTAASLPVNIASDQTVPISATGLPLPTGAATAANQTTGNGLLTSIEADTDALAGCVSGTEVQVDVLTSALPAGAATAANQATANASLSNIEADADTLAGTVSGGQVNSRITDPLPSGTATIGAVDVNGLTVVDLLDAGLVAGSSIDSNVGAFLEVVATAASDIKAAQIIDTTGSFIGVYTGAAASETLLFIFGPGSDQTIQVSIALGTRISLRSMEGSAPTAGSVAINFLG